MQDHKVWSGQMMYTRIWSVNRPHVECVMSAQYLRCNKAPTWSVGQIQRQCDYFISNFYFIAFLYIMSDIYIILGTLPQMDTHNCSVVPPVLYQIAIWREIRFWIILTICTFLSQLAFVRNLSQFLVNINSCGIVVPTLKSWKYNNSIIYLSLTESKFVCSFQINNAVVSRRVSTRQSCDDGRKAPNSAQWLVHRGKHAFLGWSAPPNQQLDFGLDTAAPVWHFLKT